MLARMDALLPSVAKDDDRPVVEGQASEPSIQLLARRDLARGVGFGRLETENREGSALPSHPAELVGNRPHEEAVQPGIES